jgi:very-short-patch-repair endonuclease
MAAVLACGERAVVSHAAAAALWEIRPEADGPITVTIVGDRARHAGIRAHQTHSLHPSDRKLLRGIPVTSAARTLLDNAADLAPRRLGEALEQAQIKRLVTKREIEAALRRAPRRLGRAALRALVADSAVTRSVAERMVVKLLRAAGLPRPAFNAEAEGYEVDALWRVERVVLEFDSHEFHATRAAFERDRRRDASLTRAGYLVLRTTWHELTERPHALVARIAEALALARAGRWAQAQAQ